MSHHEDYANCELSGHNPRYFDKDNSICLYCGKIIKSTDLTEKEVFIVDKYKNNITKDNWYHDFVMNQNGKEMKVLDKKYFNFKGWE